MENKNVHMISCQKCRKRMLPFDEIGQHNFCPTSAMDGIVITVCMECKIKEIDRVRNNTRQSNKEDVMDNIEKVIFVLRDGNLCHAKLQDVALGRIPPDVQEVMILKRDGTWTNFFPDPLGR